ncbi:MAG: hypothetical protein ACO1PB_22785 [Ramlibacter sp.]
MKSALLLCAALAANAALAAGGHHAVDDAAILEPGQCEGEGWFARAHGGERLLHAGLGCRAGAFELGAAAEVARQGGSQAAYGLSAKWAHAVADRFAIGASIGPNWQSHAAWRYQGATAAVLATWTPREDVALHLNLGRDLVHRGRDLRRHGIAAEWMPGERWSLVAERYLEERSHFVRTGARWSFGQDWSVDVSRAHRLRGPGASAWTLGVSRVIDR